MEEDINKFIKELTKVRPEMLNEEALKLFNTIMAILDERENLLKAYKQDEKMIDLMAEEMKSKEYEYEDMCLYSEDCHGEYCEKCIKEYFRKKVGSNERN